MALMLHIKISPYFIMHILHSANRKPMAFLSNQSDALYSDHHHDKYLTRHRLHRISSLPITKWTWEAKEVLKNRAMTFEFSTFSFSLFFSPFFSLWVSNSMREGMERFMLWPLSSEWPHSLWLAEAGEAIKKGGSFHAIRNPALEAGSRQAACTGRGARPCRGACTWEAPRCTQWEGMSAQLPVLPKLYISLHPPPPFPFRRMVLHDLLRSIYQCDVMKSYSGFWNVPSMLCLNAVVNNQKSSFLSLRTLK